MCDCNKTLGFKEKLAEAKALTAETRQNHVVYVHKATASVFMRKESDLTDALGICCYYLPDGTEVVYVPKAKAKHTHKKAKAEKKATSIEVTTPEAVPAEVPQEPQA